MCELMGSAVCCRCRCTRTLARIVFDVVANFYDSIRRTARNWYRAALCDKCKDFQFEVSGSVTHGFVSYENHPQTTPFVRVKLRSSLWRIQWHVLLIWYAKHATRALRDSESERTSRRRRASRTTHAKRRNLITEAMRVYFIVDTFGPDARTSQPVRPIPRPRPSSSLAASWWDYLKICWA